jgi:hypothetical protein
MWDSSVGIVTGWKLNGPGMELYTCFQIKTTTENAGGGGLNILYGNGKRGT